MALVTNEQIDARLASLLGRTIVGVSRDNASGDESDCGEQEVFLLTLDDGRVVTFGAWGFDAWGATISCDLPPDAGEQPIGELSAKLAALGDQSEAVSEALRKEGRAIMREAWNR